MTITNAKKMPGVRKLASQRAAENNGLYNDLTMDHASTFAYADIGDSLSINVIFEHHYSAVKFMNTIIDDINYFKKDSFKMEVVNPTIVPANLDLFELNAIRVSDYKNMTNDSPLAVSVDEVRSRITTYSNRAKQRDEYECKACGLSLKSKNVTKDQLRAAHILDVEEVKDARNKNTLQELLNEVDLVEPGQVANLVTLCTTCHREYFDQYKICIDYDKAKGKYFWVVKEEVYDDPLPTGPGTFRDLVGKEINFKSERKGPPRPLIEHRMNEYYKSTGKKRKRITSKVSDKNSFVCTLLFYILCFIST